MFESSKARIELFSKAFKEIEANSLGTVSKSENFGKCPVVLWPSSWFGEFFTLLDRFALNDSRDKMVIIAMSGQAIFLATIISFLYWRVSNDAQGIQNRMGMMFFLCL